MLEVLRTTKRVPARREMHLQRLREHRAISQDELAELLHVSQATVSKTERRDDVLVSTLRGFIEALGGRLQLIAALPSEIVLSLAGDKVRGTRA
ncbi:MAG TPA: helix-turn-helix domain-containing protein [Kofleriaceae bacterium]|nr:helix-turn-helix domain-containing protein [Kofleriaceae bacterium]